MLRWFGLLLLFFGSGSQAAGSWVYPKEQVWRLEQVQPLPDVTVPADLKGVPTILRLRSARFFLMPNGVAMPSLNGQGTRVLPGCFTESGKKLSFAGKAAGGKPEVLEFESLPDGRMRLVMGGLFELLLVEQVLDEQSEKDLYQFREFYNEHRPPQSRGKTQDPAHCEFQPAINPPRPWPKPLKIVLPGKGAEAILPDHLLDPWTRIRASESRTVHFVSLVGLDGFKRLMANPEQLKAPCTPLEEIRNFHRVGEVAYLLDGMNGATPEKQGCEVVTRILLIDQALLDHVWPGPRSVPVRVSPGVKGRKQSAADFYFTATADGPEATVSKFYFKLGGLDTDTPTLESIELP